MQTNTRLLRNLKLNDDVTIDELANSLREHVNGGFILNGNAKKVRGLITEVSPNKTEKVMLKSIAETGLGIQTDRKKQREEKNLPVTEEIEQGISEYKGLIRFIGV